MKTPARESTADFRSLDSETLDHCEMLQLVRAFPDQCRRAVDLSKDLTLPRAEYRSVVLLGMGGSAIGGDLLRVLLEAEGGTVPVIVTRDYRCPAFVDSHTLVLAGSYSGDTEETLAAMRDARQRGAQLCAITTGGELSAMAEEQGFPVVKVPGGQPPRSALGYMFFPGLLALTRAGLCRDFSADIKDALTALEETVRQCGPENQDAGNEAGQLAGQLYSTLPVVYGSGPVTGVAAQRWKCQFNENAKMHALWNQLPELDHNEICGWRSARRQGRLRWIFLRDRTDPPRLSRRVEVTRGILATTAVGCTDVWGTGNTLLARTLTTILIGDFVTVYAALLSNTDPIDIREIDVLKQELSYSS